MEKQAKKILVCPLNWGLGHASRCVPIIHSELEKGNEVVVAADGFPLRMLKQEFPMLRFLELPSYPIRYSKGKSQFFAMLRFIPSLIKGIVSEHKWLNRLLETEHFDQIISDNRFGMWHRRVHSVYITHQLMIKMPKWLKLMEYPAHLLHKSIIRQYDECLIPDYAAEGGLSGDLSHKYKLPTNARFIGPLSRFSSFPEEEINIACFDNLVILSGVEPQRSIFENQMITKYQHAEEKTIIIRGLPEESVSVVKVGQVEMHSHASTATLAFLMKSCRTIISRSGYSSIMDMDVLRVLKKAQFHPTPGQTEQEYLAVYLSKKK